MRLISKQITFFVSVLCFPFLLAAQETAKKEDPKNWYQLDKAETGYYGISLDKAYNFIKGKKSKTVIVAVIDSGIDTLHEDLKPILWTNPKEIPGNKKDDDHNGYVDDIHGWNFIGGKDGRNVKEDSYEGARVYHKLKAKFGTLLPDTTNETPQNKEQIEMYRKAKEKIEGNPGAAAGVDLVFLKRIAVALHTSDSILQIAMGSKTFTGKALDEYNPTAPDVIKAKSTLLTLMKGNNALDQTNKEFMEGLDQYISGEERKAEAKTTAPKDYRGDIVKDDETNINDRNYGNNDLMAGTPFHGTHCSGIIAASRNNGKGIDGIADNVRIMMVRAVPDGDEHDKDIANAIRYAVDNGAQIISMSFGKDFSPQKSWVDDAVRYADLKGVLLVHAAGNDAKNIDSAENYPNPVYVNNKGRAGNFITVGASGDPSNGGITANFSNYGKKEVDVFAPGVKIYSSIPGGNTYGFASGTSMACPVVAGIAALLLEYYPELSARQLKYVIEKSAVHLDEKVKLPGTEDKVDLADISKTGGLVNAFEATKLASTLVGERHKVSNVVKVKTKLVTHKKG